MKKYLEQRVEELELEINLLKAKFKLKETKSKSTSSYLNNYPKYDPFKVYNEVSSCCNNEPLSAVRDYMYNPSVNLTSIQELETAVASSFSESELPKSPLISVTTPSYSDSEYYNIPADFYSDFPPYPDIQGSWEEKNPKDVIEEDKKSFTTWGFESNFDKTDTDFLEWLKSNEAVNAYEISKHITNKYGKSKYRPFKVK